MKRIFIGLTVLITTGILFAANEYKQPNNAIFYGTLKNIPLNAAGIVTNTSGGQLGTVNPVPLANGGTASTTLAATAGGLVYGDGSALVSQAAGTSGQILTSGGAGVPTWTSVVPIANGGTNNGSLSTVLGGVIYSDATKLNTLAAGTSGQVLTSNGAGTPTWATSTATTGTAPYDGQNYSIAVSVAANAATIALKQANGSDCSGGSPCIFTFPSATDATGTIAQVSQTAALSVVIPSGTTIGSINAYPETYCVYLQNNAGTLNLAVSMNCSLGMTTIRSAAAISGGTDRTASYATSATTNLPTVFIGYFTATEATAGTWATSPTSVKTSRSFPQFNTPVCPSAGGCKVFGGRITNNGACAVADGMGAVASCTRVTTGEVTVTFNTGLCGGVPACVTSFNSENGQNHNKVCTIDADSTTTTRTLCTTISTQANADTAFDFHCICAR